MKNSMINQLISDLRRKKEGEFTRDNSSTLKSTSSNMAMGEETTISPLLRSALIKMGVPLKDMTKEEKKRQLARKKEVAAAETARRAQEAARLNRLTNLRLGLPQTNNLVGGGQFGTLGTGIAPRGY